MEQFLSVKEATELVGKSESTIKRLLREVVKNEDHADRTAIQPTARELSKKRDAGEPYVWRIERQFLLRSFPVDPAKKSPRTGGGDSTDTNTVPIIEVLNQQLLSKDRQIGVLEKQLDRKDEQIANQHERMHESNVLMRELQARLAITAPTASTDNDPVVVATKGRENRELTTPRATCNQTPNQSGPDRSDSSVGSGNDAHSRFHPMDQNSSHHHPGSTTSFTGFEPLSANYLYCPNQFFDLCIRNCSRGTVRIVAYLLRQTLGWLDREGNPINQTIRVTYSDLIAKAGVSRGAISKAMSDAVAAGFIECCAGAAPSRKGQTAESASYTLRWSRHADYAKSPDSFDGFYAGEGHRTPIPNSFFDHVVSKEPLTVVKVVGTVLRHTVGYQNQFGGRRTSAPLSYSYIQQYSGLNSRSDLSNALKASLTNGYIHRLQPGRFHSDETRRKAARYAVKWRTEELFDRTSSKIEPADQSKIRTSTGSNTEPANQFNNRTKEKTFSKHTNKQKSVAAEDEEVFKDMLAEGIDLKTATTLLAKRGVVVVANQIAWLDARNPTENRVGMLRKSIDEVWEKPAAVELQERQLKQREQERKQDVARRQEDAAIAETKLQRRQRKETLLLEWTKASTEDRRRWIQAAIERESSARLADIIRRDSVKVAQPQRQVLDAIAADRKLPSVLSTSAT